MVLAAKENSNSNLDGMDWSFQSSRNGELIPFQTEWNDSISIQPEWNEVYIPAGIEYTFHSRQNGMTSFHSNQIGMSSLFRPDWAFQSGRIGVPLFDYLKKYAYRTILDLTGPWGPYGTVGDYREP